MRRWRRQAGRRQGGGGSQHTSISCIASGQQSPASRGLGAPPREGCRERAAAGGLTLISRIASSLERLSSVYPPRSAPRRSTWSPSMVTQLKAPSRAASAHNVSVRHTSVRPKTCGEGKGGRGPEGGSVRRGGAHNWVCVGKLLAECWDMARCSRQLAIRRARSAGAGAVRRSAAWHAQRGTEQGGALAHLGKEAGTLAHLAHGWQHLLVWDLKVLHQRHHVIAPLGRRRRLPRLQTRGARYRG